MKGRVDHDHVVARVVRRQVDPLASQRSPSFAWPGSRRRAPPLACRVPSAPPNEVASQRSEAGFHPCTPTRGKPLRRRGFPLVAPLSGLARPECLGAVCDRQDAASVGEDHSASFVPGAACVWQWPRTVSMQGGAASYDLFVRRPSKGCCIHPSQADGHECRLVFVVEKLISIDDAAARSLALVSHGPEPADRRSPNACPPGF